MALPDVHGRRIVAAAGRRAWSPPLLAAELTGSTERLGAGGNTRSLGGQHWDSTAALSFAAQILAPLEAGMAKLLVPEEQLALSRGQIGIPWTGGGQEGLSHWIGQSGTVMVAKASVD